MALLLGNILFEDIEIPSEINFSGAHSLQIHKLVGGGRVIDAMGDDPDVIEWHGHLMGPAAASRARALDSLKKSGQRITLVFGSFARSVVVKHFKPRYQREYQIPYSISVEVDVDVAGIAPSFAGIISADFSSLAALTLPSSLADAVAGVSAAVTTTASGTATGLLQDATLSDMQRSVGVATDAFGVATTLLATADDAMSQASLDDLVTAPGNATAFLAEQIAAGAIADLSTARGYLGRIVSNLTLYGG